MKYDLILAGVDPGWLMGEATLGDAVRLQSALRRRRLEEVQIMASGIVVALDGEAKRMLSADTEQAESA